MTGKIILTFDDGTIDHFWAAETLRKYGLVGTFGIVTSKVNEAGFLTLDNMEKMKKDGHCIANHSVYHKRLGMDSQRTHLWPCTSDQILEDAVLAKEWLNKRGFDGNYFLMPFGSQNVHDTDLLNKLLQELVWIRLTTGRINNGKWENDGRKYCIKQINLSHEFLQIMGVSVAADVRHPREVKNAIDSAAKSESIATVVYHQVCHVVGEFQCITKDMFLADVEYLSKMVKDKLVTTIIPRELF